MMRGSAFALAAALILMHAGPLGAQTAPAQSDTTPPAAPGAAQPGTTNLEQAVQSKDRHAGYYYPKNVTIEEYVARAKALPTYDRKARIDFTNQLNLQVLGKPYPPPFVLYAKGEQAEKAILVSLNGEFAGTPFRMRGLLALMTTLARQTDLFKEYKVDDLFTFFDQLRLLGFEQLTVTDGKDFANQIKFK